MFTYIGNLIQSEKLSFCNLRRKAISAIHVARLLLAKKVVLLTKWMAVKNKLIMGHAQAPK
jgi:hypothetical protein